MLRVLGDDFAALRTSLIRFGLELTLAGELMSGGPNHCEKSAACSASRCLAITRLASLLMDMGIEVPENSEARAAEWRKARFGEDVEGAA